MGGFPNSGRDNGGSGVDFTGRRGEGRVSVFGPATALGASLYSARESCVKVYSHFDPENFLETSAAMSCWIQR